MQHALALCRHLLFVMRFAIAHTALVADEAVRDVFFDILSPF